MKERVKCNKMESEKAGKTYPEGEKIKGKREEMYCFRTTCCLTIVYLAKKPNRSTMTVEFTKRKCI